MRLLTFHVLLTSHVATAAAETICVLMEQPAQRSVSPQVFGTTVHVLWCLLEIQIPVVFVEIQQRRSCQDYKAAKFTTSGLYTVIDDRNQTSQVFCDFDSEPGFAWNLIESFNLSNKHLFQVIFLRF